MSFFTNSYVIAFGVPIVIILCGSFVKKIARGAGWQKQDFFLGRELLLATIAASISYLSDILKNVPTGSTLTTDLLNKIVGTPILIVFCLGFILWCVSSHQEWDKKTLSTMGQIFWLGIVNNFVGMGSFIAFILWIKGV